MATTNAPGALGPYSQAIKVGPTLYISGQIGLHPLTMEFTGDTIEDQTFQVLDLVPLVACPPVVILEGCDSREALPICMLFSLRP